MFISSKGFEWIIKLYNDLQLESQRRLNVALDLVLLAKGNEVKEILAAKEQQIRFLSEALVEARKQIKHERARAEGAIDELLAKVGTQPVRHADLQRELAFKELHDRPDYEKASKDKQVTDIFGQMNGVLEDASEQPVNGEVMASIGGMKVE